jgi:DNA-binding NarL/FixJ family response regulator
VDLGLLMVAELGLLLVPIGSVLLVLVGVGNLTLGASGGRTLLALLVAAAGLVAGRYVEQLYARELLASGRGGIGYLLKDRVFDSAQFVDAVRRVADGGTAMDPEVIARPQRRPKRR